MKFFCPKMKRKKTTLKKRIFGGFGLSGKKFSSFKIAVILAIFLVAGIFLFGGKAQGLVFGKLMVKGNFYFNGGAYDLEKAAKYYKVASYVDGKASYPHYQLARIYFVKSDFKDALAEIDTALAVNPENKRAYYIRGLIDGYAGNLKASEEDFQKFIAWAPKEWAGYNDLAWVYYQEKEYQNAAAMGRKGLEVAPDNPWLLNGLGVSLTALGENDKGKIALDRAAELSKNMTAADWRKAYPGNDAQTAEWDLAQFKTDVTYNLQLAANPFSSGKGKFQAACSSTTGNYCSGTSCVSMTCDPDHPGLTGNDEFGVPYCGTACTNDCNCGTPETWTPALGGIPAGCVYPHVGRSFLSYVDVVDGVACHTGIALGAGTGSKCIVTQNSNCGNIRCILLDPCPANNSPTVSITSPSSGSTQNPSGTIFSINVQDADNDTLTVTASTLNCPAAVQPLLGRTATHKES